MSSVSLICVVASLTLLQLPVRQDRPAETVRKNAEMAPAPHAAKEKVSIPRRHALILCGHPGDDAHTKAFSETVSKLRDGLAKSVGIPVERQYILFGAEKLKNLTGVSGPATKDAITSAVMELRKKLRPEDGLWVITLGHGHHDGRQAYWCLPGPDVSATEFGKLFAEINCREQVFVLTSSLSGYFVAPLAKRDRVVIAATEADVETNETTFPAAFARFLAAGLDPVEHDVDKDGRLTLFDLYVVVAKEIAQQYFTAEQVATEHQQLDDDGDGIGHEVQSLYLPAEQGGTPPGKKTNRRSHRDGARAVQIALLATK